MQLVYAWIKEYKNIKEQGFNFGSHYIYETEYISNRIIIRRKKNQLYIDNFFDDGNNFLINATAIVGENGSGKTNILTFLFDIFDKDSDFFNLYNFLIFENENKEIFIYNKRSLINAIKYFKLLDFKAEFRRVDSYLFNYDFWFMFYGSTTEYMSIFHKPKHKFFDITSKEINELNTIALNQKNSPFTKTELNFLNEMLIFSDFYVEVEKNIEKFSETSFLSQIKLPKISININSNFKKFKNEHSFFSLFYGLHLEVWTEVYQIYLKRVNNTIYEVEKNDLKNQFIIFSIILSQTKNIPEKETIFNYFKSSHSDFIFLLRNIFVVLYGNDAYEILQFFENSYDLEIGIEKDYTSYYSYKLIDSYIRMIRALNENKNIELRKLPFDVKWSYSLSDGETKLIRLYANFYLGLVSYVPNIVQLNKNNPFGMTIILLLDEPDIGLHMHWQKNFIKTTIRTLQEIYQHICNDYQVKSMKLQIIFATHSPITLSDIPLSNIIYLKISKQRTVKVLNDWEKPKHSFGANIHELIADSFYLKDGTIGSFAKSKIQEVIEWCNNIENKDGSERISKIINIIDEPIIKIKLTELFAKKMGSDIEIAKLNAQKEYIEKRLQELNNNDNDRDKETN